MVAIIPTVKEFFSAVENCGELITAEILFLSMFVKMLISGIIKNPKNDYVKTFVIDNLQAKINSLSKYVR